MKDFFYPKNIAVVGVSNVPGNLGKLIVQNLEAFGFTGRWHAVGHIPGQVCGQPIHESVLDIPEEIDLAAILTKSEYVPDVVEACGQKGIRRLTISTAGFSEYSPEGIALEQRILDTCKRYNIRFIGPNCLAVMNMENGLCLPFSTQDPRLWSKGPVGVIAQSGTVAMHYSKHLSYGKVGVGKVASIGNKLNVDEVDLLAYLLEDPQTELVFMYLESFSRPRKLLELAASSSKPILVHKSNISAMSESVAKSHTNAVTGNDRITQFALEQSGIIRVRDIHDTLNCVKAALLPPLKGNRMVVMSPGGGTAVMGADEAHRHGFELPDLPVTFLEWLKSKGRAGVINLTNPLDLGDIYEIGVYGEAIDQILSQPDIDGVFMDMGYAEEWRKMIPYDKFFDYFNKRGTAVEKPIFLRANVSHPAALQRFDAAVTLPYFESMPGAFRAIAKVLAAQNISPLKPAAYRRPDHYTAIRQILGHAQDNHKYFLDCEGFDIMRAMDITVPKYRCISKDGWNNEDGLDLHFPVALKAIGDNSVHKTGTGAIKLDIQDGRSLTTAITAMREVQALATTKHLMIQEMAARGIEILVGAKRDPQFGPVVVVGAGGVQVELWNDVCAAPAPVGPEMARRMIASLKSHPLLTGYRGSAPADVAALTEIIVKVSNLMVAFPEIEEIDLNPVMVMDQGAVPVDCKIFLNKKAKTEGQDKTNE
jgi:acyl-CoA synthetase (NDP forming)